MAMPWSRAKAIAAEYRAGIRDVKQLTALFDACFRIATEAGIPIVVENVRGAQPWVGRSRWHYGSFHLWGDVPALMPIGRHIKSVGQNMSIGGKKWCRNDEYKGPNGGWFNDSKRNGGKATGYLSRSGSRSLIRKAMAAAIAKIPFALSSHIARVYKP